MTHQPSFSQAESATKKKTTRREKFLTRMETVVPWPSLLAVSEPFYPKGERGRPPIGLERRLRVCFRQPWDGLADERLSKTRFTTVRHSKAWPALTWRPKAGLPPPTRTTPMLPRT